MALPPMTLPPILAESDGFGEIAQLVIFMILAIGGAIQHVLKKRAEERRRSSGQGGGKHEAEPAESEAPMPQRRVPEPASSAPQRRPAVFPAARTSATLSAHGLAQPGHGGRVVILADPQRRVRALTGRQLLFAKAPSPRDRVRAAVLWHEALGPPPSLGG